MGQKDEAEARKAALSRVSGQFRSTDGRHRQGIACSCTACRPSADVETTDSVLESNAVDHLRPGRKPHACPECHPPEGLRESVMGKTRPASKARAAGGPGRQRPDPERDRSGTVEEQFENLRVPDGLKSPGYRGRTTGSSSPTATVLRWATCCSSRSAAKRRAPAAA